MIRQGRFFRSVKLLTKPLDDCSQIFDVVLEHLPKLSVMRRLGFVRVLAGPFVGYPRLLKGQQARIDLDQGSVT
jgi:hypothetical protein